MKLSLNWLKDYIDPKLKTDELIHRLVMAGWEVEAVESVGKDTVFELEITPNRPDCLNILGLAREIGAIASKKVKYPKIKAYKDTSAKVSITVEDKKDCSRYTGTLLKDVSIQGSPKNISDRITSLGLKPISNAVDVTNFVLMETGQPLHVFDYDKLSGGKIIVRRAKEGEKIVTIDGVERSLDPSVLVIADADKPVAIAGIMGGKDTEVTSSTKNILLESAHFDMALVRRASRKLGLRSDSSYRFERNVDWEGVLTGANRATDLLIELTKGTFTARTDVAFSTKKLQKAITITPLEVENILGVSVSLPEMRRILANLDFKVTVKASKLSVVPPSFRGDIKQSVDLIEEVARMIGFDRLPTSLPHIKAKNLVVDSRAAQIKKVTRQTLLAQGLDEAVTLSMISKKSMVKCQLENVPVVKVSNPLSQENELMRFFLVPSLLQVALTNINRGQKDIRIFEIAKRYTLEGERDSVAILLTGKKYSDWRLNRKDQVDFYDMKGILENLFKTLRIKVSIEDGNAPVFDPSCKATMVLNGKVIGGFGKVDPAILNNWDIKNQDVYYAGVDLEAIYALPATTIAFAPLPEFPGVSRDISIAVKKDVSWKAIEDICRAKGRDILADVQFVEQYLGDKIQPGCKGLVFSCFYQSKLRTLREEEVTATHEEIVKSLIEQVGALRR